MQKNKFIGVGVSRSDKSKKITSQSNKDLINKKVIEALEEGEKSGVLENFFTEDFLSEMREKYVR